MPKSPALAGSNQCQMIKYQIYFLKFELWISFELGALTFDIKHILLLTNA